MFSKRVKHYHQWLRSAIPFKAKLDQISSDSVRVQGPTKRSSLGHLYPVSPVIERYRKGGKCKISRVYSRLFLVPKPHQRWRPVIDLSRLNTFLHVEKFKMETPESIRTYLIPEEWEGPWWQSGNTLASHLCGRVFDPRHGCKWESW